MKAVMKREWNSLYNTMTAPIFSAVLIAVIGIYFVAYNLNSGYPYFSYTLLSTLFILMVTVPLLTMRSFADERKQKTDQILLTSPLRVSDIVLGKFFALCGVLLFPCILFCVCPIIIGSIGTSYPLTDYSALIAYFCIGALFIAVGLFISSLTESQVIAAVGTFAALLVIYLWQGIASMLPSTAKGSAVVVFLVLAALCLVFYNSTKNWAAAGIVFAVGAAAIVAVLLLKPDWLADLFSVYLADIAVTSIFENFAYNNLFDLSGLLSVLIGTAFLLFLTGQSLEKRRWS
ncbi:MAG: ABC transporter permease [Oscillospiraceae bacterium]|nr:ABC transporter permease [Oscillospiraceae bacterium]